MFAFVCELLRMKVSAMAGCYKMGNINITNELKWWNIPVGIILILNRHSVIYTAHS